MTNKVKPLYRKVNTRARNHHHWTGGDARNDRNTKYGVKRNMSKNDRRGLDYTPLYKFLLSKVGCDWDEVYKEAYHRLDRDEPIFWMVVLRPGNELDCFGKLNEYFRSGESSYFSTMYVNEHNKLQLVNPDLKNEDLEPSCGCCTWTLNGKVLNKKYIKK